MEDILKQRIEFYKGKDVDERHFKKSKIVRIFISSTFSDMKVERDHLIERAYPQLRAYCQSKQIDFQIIDMRWGIQDSASVDHSTCDLCLTEIKACKRLSMGPFFVAFIGNRYGYRPLPPTILNREFDIILNYGSLDENTKNLLHTWYVLDENSVPSRNVLQPINNILPHYDDINNIELRNKAREEWNEISTKLETSLRVAVSTAKENQLMDDRDVEKFFQSVTEFEIREGFMKKPASSSLYHRNIIDIDDHIEDDAIGNYIDLAEKDVNNEAQSSLKHLKSYLERMATKSSAIKTYDVNWSNGIGIDASVDEHKDYLEKFCEDFVDDIKKGIQDTTGDESGEEDEKDSIEKDDKDSIEKDEKDSIEKDSIFDEVAHHAHFTQTKISSFCGREKLLDHIASTLMREGNVCPVALHGISGSGKTSVMAKMKEICTQQSNQSIVLTRFFGTSPDSSQIHLVLKSLILQISTIFQLAPPPPHVLESFVAVTQQFEQLLYIVSDQMKEDEILFIILDSIDQLSPLDGAYRLNWLPKNLPARVKILVSTLPDPKIGCLDLLRRFLPEENVIEVSEMNVSTGKEILNSFLSKINRTLTKEQRNVVMSAFTQCPNPLFMKLAFDEAKLWHSYTRMNNVKLGKNVRDCISGYFDRLEAKHSYIFTSRAIGYIVAARNGLMESELDDLLSLDNDVLDNAYQYWPPPNRNNVRVPTLLWVRLRHDLGEDLVERQSVGKTVLGIYHRQFVEVARERYLSGKIKTKIHANIALYFLGTYADGKKKTVLLKIWDMEPVATDRKVPSQPLEITKGVYNKRKLDELPYHLLHACEDNEDTLMESFAGRVLCEEILCNAKWLDAKISAFSIKDALNDYEMVLAAKPLRSIQLICEALKIAKPTLEFEGGVRNSLTMEMFGRLEYFKHRYKETLDPFLDQCDSMNRALTNDGLIPLKACFQPPGEELKATLIGLSSAVTCVVSKKSSDDITTQSYLAAGSLHGSIIVWALGTDDILHTFNPRKSAVIAMDIKGLRLVSMSADFSIYVFNLDTGSCVNSFCDSNVDDVIKMTELKSVVLSHDSAIVVSCVGNKTSIWDVTSGEKLHILEKTPQSLLSCRPVIENGKIICGYKDGSVICWTIDNGKEEFRFNQRKVMNKIAKKSPVEMLQFSGTDLKCWWQSGHFAQLDHINVKRSFVTEDFSISAQDEDLIALADGKIVNIWMQNQQETTKIAVLRHHDNVISSLAWLPCQQDSTDIKQLVVGSQDSTISVWKMNKYNDGNYKVDDTPCDVIIGMGAPVDFIIPVNNHVFVTASLKVFYLKVWRIGNDEGHDDEVDRIRNLPFTQHNHDVSSCGEQLVLFDRPKSTVKIFDISAAPRLKQLDTIFIGEGKQRSKKESNPIMVKMSHDSKTIYCAFTNGKLLTVPAVLDESGRRKQKKSANLSSDCESQITACCLSVGENYLVVNLHKNKDENNLVVVDEKSLKVIHLSSLKGFGLDGIVTCITTSSTLYGEDLAVFVGSSLGEIHVFRFIKTDSSFPNSAITHCKLQGHTEPLTTLGLNADGSCLLSGTDGKIRKLWKLKNGQEWSIEKTISSASFLNPKVSSIAFTADGKFVVIGSHERNIKIYQVSTGNLIASQYVYAPVVGLTTCGQKIISRTNQGYIITDLLYIMSESSRN